MKKLGLLTPSSVLALMMGCEGRVERTTPAVFSGDETADVGKDDATQVVAAFENVRDSHFTGSVKSVTVDTAMP